MDHVLLIIHSDRTDNLKLNSMLMEKWGVGKAVLEYLKNKNLKFK